MIVTNRCGTLVPFEKNKLKKSIEGASMDANFSLTEGDLDSLTEEIFDILKDIEKKYNVITYNEIIKTTCDVLTKNYFTDVATAYKNIYASN